MHINRLESDLLALERAKLITEREFDILKERHETCEEKKQ
jgi:hypothetical protein